LAKYWKFVGTRFNFHRLPLTKQPLIKRLSGCKAETARTGFLSSPHLHQLIAQPC